MFMGMALRTAVPTQAVFVTQWCSLYESRDAWRAARNWLAEWLAFSRHQHIVCASEGNVRQFLYAGMLDDRSRVTVIPNPVEPPVAADPEVVARMIPPVRIPSIKTLVFLGRLERQKRPDWLLKAWKMALNRGLKDARLLILGQGSWRPLCEKMIRENLLSDSVHLLGHRTDAAAYLQNADGLLLTSLYEGHANVVLEALACGVPVLTMATDGAGESLRDGVEGFIAPLGDIPKFAERLLALVQDDGLRKTMGHNAQMNARDHDPAGQREAFRQLIVTMLNSRGKQD
jgi:glycosyltransferase involved in cell wall biosynthesis